MISFQGRIKFLQYNPLKPTKWGIKAFALADSKCYYMLKFSTIYEGKSKNKLEKNKMLVSEQIIKFY